MDNQEIRAKARMLYRKYFGFVLLLGLCSGGLSSTAGNLIEYFFQNEQSEGISLLLELIAIPLTVGAVACIEPLWMKEQRTLNRLFDFYYPLSQFGNSLVLSIAPILLMVAILLLGTLIFSAVFLSAWMLLLLLIPLFWLMLRFQMSMMLFASGRKASGVDALIASYELMRGNELDLLGMTVLLMFPQVSVELGIQLYTQHNGINLLVLLFDILFHIFYLPYQVLATQGWVLERLKDGEQPQESENKRNQGSFLADIKKETEPSSEGFKDEQ